MNRPQNTLKATIIPRSEHCISRNDIHPNALKVLYRLHNAGYRSYLVGGCVRDLLLGRKPKDFDIATNAKPEEVRKLFRNCRLIGRRFRLAHILFGREIIEVATFRTHHQNAEEHEGKTHLGMIIRDNVYGNIEDDALRRDFTINALYYNIADFSVVDYTGGIADIQAKQLRLLGNPEERFMEDPVRMLRAIRLMSKLNLHIHPDTEKYLYLHKDLLKEVSSARLFQEVLKIFHDGATANTYQLLQKYHFLEYLFPDTAHYESSPESKKLLSEVLKNTDERAAEQKTVSPAFLLTAFLWHPILQTTLKYQAEGFPPYVALEKSMQHTIQKQTKHLAIPRTLLVSIRDICLLQHFFTFRNGNRPYRTLQHPRFRAGYDLLVLRAKTDEAVQELADWWTAFQNNEHATQEKMLKESSGIPKKQNRYYRNRKPRVLPLK